MRLVLIWFATWKNAGSSYPPDWVRADSNRFPPMVLKVRPDGGISTFLAKKTEEQGTGPQSPFGKDTVKADAKANGAAKVAAEKTPAKKAVKKTVKKAARRQK